MHLSSIVMNRLLLIISIILLCTCSLEAQKKRVLILHSYHQGLHWTDNTSKGILSVLGLKKNIDLQFDYLDTKRNPSKHYFELLSQLYYQKLESRSFDAIITVDNNALSFVKQNQKKLFPDIPVIFCGVNNYIPEMIHGMDNVTGITEKTDFSTTMETMIQLEK